MGKNNIWTMVADSHQNSPMAEMDWTEMEGLFCQQATSAHNSPKMGARDSTSNSVDATGVCTEQRKSRKENSEVNYSLWSFCRCATDFQIHDFFFIFTCQPSADYAFGWQTKPQYQHFPETIPNVSYFEEILVFDTVILRKSSFKNKFHL